ncbi:MAG: ankyrin repeat domain-containing protein [Planctomyces sp.]
MNQNRIHRLFLQFKRYIDKEDWDSLRRNLGTVPSLRSYSEADDSLLSHAYFISPKTVRETVSCGVNPNLPFTDGTTLLMCYASRGNLKMVKFLLNNGADVNAVANCGETAFSWSCVSDRLACAIEIQAHGGTWKSSVMTTMDLVEQFGGSAETKSWLRSL